MRKKHDYDIEVSTSADIHKLIPGGAQPGVTGYSVEIFRDVHTLIGKREVVTRFGVYWYAGRKIIADKIKLWIVRR